MRPSNLKINSSSSFFSSPYRSSYPAGQLSPIPSEGRDSAPPSSQNDPTTPLLPPTPSMAEKGRESFPFPSDSRGLWTRIRLATSGSYRSTAKRVLGFILLAGILLMIGRQAGDLLNGLAEALASNTGRAPQDPSQSGWKMPPVFPSRPPPVQPNGNESALGEKREIDLASDALPLEATLRQRLDVWRYAPGGRGEIPGEVELGGFMQWNLEQCDTISEVTNEHMVKMAANTWASMNRTTLHNSRMDLINHMEDVLAHNLTADYGQGRGIVMVAGNADTLQRAKWSIQMLRSYDSELPVQIYHFPSESPADDDPIRAELKELGAELVAAAGQEKDEGKKKSYHLKAIAVVQSPWREVLYLDSDSVPARDPEYMFDAPNYKRLGLWATPDYWKTSANNPIWAIMGVKCRNEWEMETGQMFIDKKHHLDVFYLIKYMLERHEWWFYFSDGDKDIFRWAMLALRKRWGSPGRWVGAAALPSGTASGEFCSHTMLQHDSWGEPLFVHYNLLKQIPSGVGRGYSWGRTKQLPLFNLFPASPATARLGEPEEKPVDDHLRGLGDVDCDMLADADEYGNARSPAKEMIMRRAVRERGVKAKYHGGWISALCIDLEYIDPRPQDRKDADEAYRRTLEDAKKAREDAWQMEVEQAKAKGLAEPEKPEDPVESPVRPDWTQSPIEVVWWRDDPALSTFEKTIYDLGFKPNGPGF
ncbi:mannosyltransferase putative-domain-containing protein [Papiliotrema laurentii]|uniref:Mannosyltransferase putative-domain-containing protein n=1 Tax=Papiliotrema laurentii TaxID=5418 RepID=A0AAD9FUE6_PAPLA|nr:mannosyltransferase putative-domain-containing protein [Papiliotrema laurentii]